jgi:hypothetical protein
MTADKFRSLALELAGVSERAHMGHPDFRVEGKIIATLGYPDESWGMVKLTPEQQKSFVTKAPDAFRPCNGTWGERGATNVRLDSAKVSFVRAALDAAWQNVVVKKATDESAQRKKDRRSMEAANRPPYSAG